MSRKNSNTTADYLDWDTMLLLIRKLFDDKSYRIGLLIGCGSFFGLRISDLLSLKWVDLLKQNSFEIRERKTKKLRTIHINDSFQRFIVSCHDALAIQNDNEPCFLSQKGNTYSVQRINVLFKQIKCKYQLKVEHFSTHSLRKTFGRKVVDNAGINAEMALIKLSEIFNHSSVQITRKYLGLRQDELEEVYLNLDF